jgi:hypothetical protein
MLILVVMPGGLSQTEAALLHPILKYGVQVAVAVVPALVLLLLIIQVRVLVGEVGAVAPLFVWRWPMPFLDKYTIW